jgi:hypothetical protein
MQTKQTLKIEIPDGYEIDGFDKASGQIIIKEKPKSPIERIRTIDDLLADHHLTKQKFDQQNIGLADDEVAYRLLKLLGTSLNEGWKPDWTNHSETKYYPYFEMRGSSGFRFLGCAHWLSTSSVGSRLAFKSKELATHAGTQFRDVYEKFMNY